MGVTATAPVEGLAFEVNPSECEHDVIYPWKRGTLHRYCAKCGLSGKTTHNNFAPHILEEIIMAASTKKAEPTVTRIEIRYVPDEKLGDVFMHAMLGQPEGFLDPKDMTLIDSPGFKWTKRSPSHPRNLEKVYNNYQKVDGDPSERTEQLGVRSMSTGDCLVIDGTAYYVSASGFVTKTGDKLIPVESPDGL
jgi:hypothetical protein